MLINKRGVMPKMCERCNKIFLKESGEHTRKLCYDCKIEARKAGFYKFYNLKGGKK